GGSKRPRTTSRSALPMARQISRRFCWRCRYPASKVHARVMLLDINVLARLPALLQLLPRSGKQRQELAFVVERGHDLMPPLVLQWIVCVPAHHPAIDVIIVWIDPRHCSSIAPVIATSGSAVATRPREVRGLKA